MRFFYWFKDLLDLTIFLNFTLDLSQVTPFPTTHIFRYIEERLGCFVSRHYHRWSMVFIGRSLAQKCCRVSSNNVSNSFFYKIKKTKFNSSTDRQHDNPYLLNMGRTQNKHLIKVSKEMWSYLIERKCIWQPNIYPVWTIKQQTRHPKTSRTAANGSFPQLVWNKFAVI